MPLSSKFLPESPDKKWWKLVNIYRRYWKKYNSLFFGPACRCFASALKNALNVTSHLRS